MRRTVRSATAAIAIAIVGGVWCLTDVPAAVTAPRSTYGMNLRAVTREQARKMVELGGSTVRVVFGWDGIEGACKGCFNFSQTDAWVAEARRTGLQISATLSYSPRWANGGHTFNYPPLIVQDWYDFVFTVVSRYKDDVHLWGIWNEPNLDVYWHGGDLTAYQTIAIAARAAIRAADSTAVVLGPDVSHHALKEGWYVAAMRSIGALFDIVTVHWYPDGPDLEFMMDQMVRPFAGGKDVWLTEAGMKPCESVLAEAGQLALYNKVLKAFLPRRFWWTGVMFYDLYDPPDPKDCGSGITRFDYSNRPAFTLYQQFIRAYP